MWWAWQELIGWLADSRRAQHAESNIIVHLASSTFYHVLTVSLAMHLIELKPANEGAARGRGAPKVNLPEPKLSWYDIVYFTGADEETHEVTLTPHPHPHPHPHPPHPSPSR